MEIVLTSLAFVVALLCAGTMGYAIQRGATCTVAAVDELLDKRSARRLASLAEASVWVAGGLLVAQALRLLPQMPPGYAVSGFTLLGAALLGLGAWVNRACVFGAVARFGSGEWAYALTPLGYYLGCLSLAALFAPPAPQKLDTASPVLAAPAGVLVAFLAFAAWRLWRLASGRRGGDTLAARIWSPHQATTVIGVTFVVMLLSVGAWAYTDLLAGLARGMASSVAARTLLALALLAGAVAGGWTAGRWRPVRPGARQLLRCLLGGALMGWGTLLIPGSNDGLILVGMPLLWPYAWLAFAGMCLAIAAAEGATRAARRARSSLFDHGRDRRAGGS